VATGLAVSGALPAFAAAVVGVLGVWELLGSLRAPALGRVLGGLGAPLARLLREGREPDVGERRRLVAVAAVVLGAGGWLLAGPLAGAALAAGAPAAVAAVLRARRHRRRVELEAAAPALARAIADALGAGHAIPRALAEAARELRSSGPAGAELCALADALALGASLEDALVRLRERVASRPYDVLAAAMLLQRDAGGDLASLLRELADAQAEALRLAADARAATAQARFTGLVVALMPLGAAALAELASPGSLVGLARAPLAAWLAGFAGLLQLLALVAIRRLARVER